MKIDSLPKQTTDIHKVLLASIYREFVRFFRQKSRLVGSLMQPLIFWLLFGAGLHATFKPPVGFSENLTYAGYFLPGILSIIIMFTSIFSTITIIEDRSAGFLQGVLVSPAPRSSIVLGKILSGSLVAMTQVFIFLLMIPVLYVLGIMNAGIQFPSFAKLILSMGYMFIFALSLTSFGYMVASPLKSIQGFHAIMSVVFFPMWMLSGAVFPVPSTGILMFIMKFNPMTYGVSGLQQLLLPVSPDHSHPSILFCTFVLIAFFGFCLFIDIYLTQNKSLD